MTPRERYLHDLKSDDMMQDSSQSAAVDKLQKLYDQLNSAPTKHGLGQRIRALFGGQNDISRSQVRGLYLWGGVGRGKTYLMDIFFDSLPFEEKTRLHFHRFMREVHRQLGVFRGRKNPLELIADQIAGTTRVLCFDEFYVSDITDAMLLGTLMSALFDRGVVLVATSNIPPNQLYRDGLQRARFMPAIDAILKHTDVHNVNGGVDYRLRNLERMELFHVLNDGETAQGMEAYFFTLVPDAQEILENQPVEIEGRHIRAHKIAEDVVWFDFTAICDGPRSQNDYIELAREFQTVLISRVPKFDNLDDQARRFINLVDEFYDRGVKLILSATAPLEDLYAKGRLAFEFQRTQSRLLEMQSLEYLKRPHRP